MCLDVEAAGESRERTRGPDDAMARRHDRQGIPAVRRPDGARGARVPDLLRDLCVGTRLAEWNGHQRTPHRALKRRSRRIQPQFELWPAPAEIFLELPLRLQEHRVVVVFLYEVQPHTTRAVALPED